MKINVSLTVGGEVIKHETIEIDDDKLEPLTEEELEAAIEVNIRTWAENNIHIAWEVQSEDDASEVDGDDDELEAYAFDDDELADDEFDEDDELI